jgi:hypothetical protein
MRRPVVNTAQCWLTQLLTFLSGGYASWYEGAKLPWSSNVSLNLTSYVPPKALKNEKE